MTVRIASAAFALVLAIAGHTRAADPLSSWNDTAPKQAIVSFVEKVTKEGSTDFVPPAFHLDASVQQLLPLGPGFVSVGFNAFYYEQIEGDSGSGAKLGGFEGRDIGIGPALGYILPVGENTLVAEARWLPELETKRRLEGDFFWLKLVYQF